MVITVIGCGRWGSFIAWYLNKIGHSVSLYGRETSKNMQKFLDTRSNGLLTLPESVSLTTSMDTLPESEVIIISVDSQSLSGVVADINALSIRDCTVVLCMKGLDVGTGRRLSQVASGGLHPSNRVAVWLGPGHVQEFVRGIPNCMVIDSADEETKKHLVDSFSSELIRFYYGNDLLGNEIGAAAKNVIGIAAGMLDGLDLSTLKGALMSRGTREIARLIAALGGSELSAYGLCHLGDYEATIFSEFSNNRRFGEAYVLGERFDKLAEGYYTVRALMRMGEESGVELPICGAVHEVLYNGKKPSSELNALFTRSVKSEF